MGYMHIDNLYKDKTILLFKECYALEKIHGTSAHIAWDCIEKTIRFFSGGEKHEKFIKLFDHDLLHSKFLELFLDSNVVIYGEAYGGKQQGMSATYGKELKFIAFDVKVNGIWVNVLNAESISSQLEIEFVSYIQCSTDLAVLDAIRDKESVQSIRNGLGHNKISEGIVLRPLLEMTDSRGNRVMAKYKRDEFKETKTPRVVNHEELKIINGAKAIAGEWVTEMRLKHVLDKLPQGIGAESTRLVIDAMVEDIYREAKGEIIESNEVKKCICNMTSTMFIKMIKSDLK